MTATRRLETLQFDNSYGRLPESLYTRLNPTPFAEPPYLVGFSESAAALLDLPPEEATRPEFVGLFGGSLLIPESDPLAMLYSGHQFGVYVPQLGDGRAILLGEVRNQAGEKWDLHLKGAGKTPYSRDGDGRAVLRSSIREFLCSEAMHGLGIPTTRALCVVGSDEKVWRETVETGAMLLRMAPSHVRFGTFEIFYYRHKHDLLVRLADYVIENHFPAVAASSPAGSANRYLAFFQDVVIRTAQLLAQWQAVGFAHGVMNTDNMSILGLTLDYGPFGFLDDYDPSFICNHSDHHGRYAFDQQPSIALWNLSCLAQALLPLAPRDPLKAALDTYQAVFQAQYRDLMRAKLGGQEARPEDEALTNDLLVLLAANHVDYTLFFRRLGGFTTAADATNEGLRDLFVDRDGFDRWAARYRDRLREEGSVDQARKARMDRVNPKYILRSYLAQQAIEQATQQGDYSEVDRLVRLLESPYAEQPDRERYAALPPNWGKHIVVSCSS